MGVFKRVHHFLKRASKMHVQLTADVSKDLDVWCNLVSSLASRHTHLCDLWSFTPTWMGTTDTSDSGMGTSLYGAPANTHTSSEDLNLNIGSGSDAEDLSSEEINRGTKNKEREKIIPLRLLPIRTL